MSKRKKKKDGSTYFEVLAGYRGWSFHAGIRRSGRAENPGGQPLNLIALILAFKEFFS